MTNSASWLVYQPLIVGLGAVVLASIGNTLVEWYRQTLQDRREARVVRSAFVEELRTHRRTIAGAMSDEQRQETEGSFLVPVDTFMPVYDNMIGKIGALKPEEAGAILKAYSYIVLTPKNLLILGRMHRDEFASFVEVPVKFAHVLDQWNKDMIGVIDETLACLEGRRLPVAENAGDSGPLPPKEAGAATHTAAES